MADSLNEKKRTREEDGGNLMSGPQQNIAENVEIPPSEVLADLDTENQPQEEDTSRITCIHPLRLRELGKNRKLPNIYNDYHVHAFESDETLYYIKFIVPGDDIVLVVHSDFMIALFRRQGDRISAVGGDSIRASADITSVCYNNHNNSFLIASQRRKSELEVIATEILSLEIASIQAEQNPKLTKVFPGESCIMEWYSDIPACRGMIHNPQDRKFKFCELEEYKLLFTLPDLGSTLLGGTRLGCAHFGSFFKSLSPGNMETVMYEARSENGRLGVQLRIYSKLDGILQKEIFVPQPSGAEMIDFVSLCGSDTVVMQMHRLHMEVVDISCENPVSIKRRNTQIRSLSVPYYLHKRSQMICYCDKSIHVCNLQGEILVTLEDHPVLEGATYPTLFLHFGDYISFSYIPDSQDIIISLCRKLAPPPSEIMFIYSINISSLVTGECLANITSEYGNSSEIRKAALNHTRALGYDERTHQIFTGCLELGYDGTCCVWSNKFHKDEGGVRI